MRLLMSCHTKKCSKHKTGSIVQRHISRVHKLIFFFFYLLLSIHLYGTAENTNTIINGKEGSGVRQVHIATVNGCCSISQKDRWR